MSRLDYCKYELVDDCYDWKNDNCDGCNIFKAYCEGARRAKNLIVLCKDCKNWRESHSEDEESYCYIDGRTTDSMGYCSWGERKEP